MSRRPSALSFSFPQPLANGQPKIVQSPVVTEAPAPSRQASVSKSSADTAELDPDELFTKHTISEVKVVQQRLRADADAKQEELRLMVGERYRDLLQASTSIISIARSSKRVIEALQETKDAILAQDAPPMPRRISTHGGDAHLHTLQVLSAHMKLLLDAPEYLWRLIERKKYFTAAWLFLLARVVHRALVRDDEQDEETWSAQGLDVLEQFPLAQRQWEAVSQFRSQIIHKATLSLREYTASAEDACAALLTLHLLDSRPLTETLSVFLNQRSKTLLAMLSRTAETNPPLPASLSRRANGHISDKGPSSTRKVSVREVKEATQTALDAMVKTLTTSRSVFEETESKPSMIGTVLEYIQSDSPGPEPNSKSLPSELQLTTQSLLATLPSHTHFLLLPPSLRSYKPYVDLTSSSSLIEQTHFSRVLYEWFRTSNQTLQVAASKWFADLHTVAEVWTLRASIRQWIVESTLKLEEMETLKSIFDGAAQQRVLNIWKLALSDAEDAFQLQLAAATTSLRETPKDSRKDSSPVEFLFNAPPLPVFPGMGPVDSSFQKYRGSLRRQLLGRTSLLDSVLATLESCARSLQRDLSVVLAGETDEARGVAAQLSEQYRPNAEALCTGVLDTLSAAEKQDSDDSELTIDSLVFVGHVADELGTSSPFVSGIGGGAEVVQDFKKRTKALHDRIIDRWRSHTVSKIIGQRRAAARPRTKAVSTLTAPSTPSPELVESLLTLSSSIQELAVSRSRGRQNTVADKTLRVFITEWVGDGWTQDGAQALRDIALLRRLADLRTPEWEDVCQLLDSKAQEYEEQVGIPSSEHIIVFNDHPQLQQASSLPTANGWNDGASDYLSRTQTLFAPLLPLQSPMRTLDSSTDKFAPLLPFGSPATDQQQFQPAVELAKPSSRFGLLLVGTSVR
ncbi:Vps51/Vps67 domain-containing protein [Mycena galericulata]|nr:Vps51/Vps67 domain-containing protein [Mycena galericulata]